jgi:hypothetical protein
VTNRSRARWSLAVALAAHGLVMAWTFGRTHRPLSAAQNEPMQLAELEVAVEPAPPPAAPTAEAQPSPTEPSPAAVAMHVASRSATPGRPDAPAEEVSPAPVLSANPVDNGSWTFSPTKPSPQAGGIAGAGALNKATVAGIDAVLAAAEKKAESRRRKPLVFTPRDMEIGLVPGSQYVALARDRVRNSLTPMNGHALLEVWTDSRGIVARVRVLDPSSDPGAWQEVADALVEDAHGSFPVKIPDNADGLIITLDVTSALRTLTGEAADRGALSRVIGAVTNPVDALLDSKAAPQRMVSARVVGVEAF